MEVVNLLPPISRPAGISITRCPANGAITRLPYQAGPHSHYRTPDDDNLELVRLVHIANWAVKRRAGRAAQLRQKDAFCRELKQRRPVA